MIMLSLSEVESRRKKIKDAGLSQKEIAFYLQRAPQQIHDATNGFQPKLWEMITKIIASEKEIKKVKKTFATRN